MTKQFLAASTNSFIKVVRLFICISLCIWPNIRLISLKFPFIFARVRLKNSTDSDITVDIKGIFIINNGLEETWRKLRGFSDDVIIDQNFINKILFFQTLSLWIVQNNK